MTDDKSKQRSREDAELELEIRNARTFTLEEAIGRMVGPGGMKGESPIPRLQQAEIEIASWLRTHLVCAGGELETVLSRNIQGSDLLLSNPEQPLVVLAAYCQQVLDSDAMLREIVRQADVEWGAAMGERPYFERAGKPCDENDPFTVESVRAVLAGLVQQLAAGKG